MSHIRIVFGTTGGNTQLVCEEVAAVLEKSGHRVSLERCEMADPQKMTDCDCLVLACPTYGQGQLEFSFEHFFQKIQDVDLKGTKCAVIGLGDKRYDFDRHFESMGTLNQYVAIHGGQLIGPPLAVEGSPVPQLDTTVREWAENLSKLIQ